MLKSPKSDGISNIDLKPHWICSLEDELGSLVWVTLRDDTYYVGLFKTFDQYGNIVLTDAIKKIVLYKNKSFSDIYCGYTIIRGESISYFCSVDVVMYLRVFDYEGYTSDEWLSQLKSLSLRGRIDSSTKDVSMVLKYIELEEALRLLKEERQGTVIKSIEDILMNE